MKKNIFLTIISIILLLYVAFLIRNLCIINKISTGNAQYLTSKNYHLKITDEKIEKEVFFKDNICMQITTDMSSNTQTISWYNANTQEWLLLWPESNQMKETKSEKTPITVFELTPVFDQCTIWEKLQISALSLITTENNCYKITSFNNTKYLVNKSSLVLKQKTGELPVFSSTNLSSDEVTTLNYEVVEFNTVTDSQIQKPDISKYVIGNE